MGTTVIRYFPGYIALSRGLGARRFDLDRQAWALLPRGLQWRANRHFLDRMIAADDSFVRSTDPRLVRPGTWLFRELRHLQTRGVPLPRRIAWTH